MTSMLAPIAFDLDMPPVLPPRDCVDMVVWHLAKAQFDQHDPACPTCLRTGFCDGRWLARQGLLTACGQENLLSDYWRGLARRRWAEFSGPGVRRGEINPDWWEPGSQFGGEPMVDILERRDMGKVFAFLRCHGWSRIMISAATGLAEDAAVKVRLGRRKITAYEVLVRIAEGLRIPREAMGLGQAHRSPEGPTRSGGER